jgi:hypothetical protein
LCALTGQGREGCKKDMEREGNNTECIASASRFAFPIWDIENINLVLTWDETSISILSHLDPFSIAKQLSHPEWLRAGNFLNCCHDGITSGWVLFEVLGDVAVP